MKSVIILIAFLIIASAWAENNTNATENLTSESVLAKTYVPNPGITPDSPFYFVKQFWEGFRDFITTAPIEKAKLHLEFAASRLYEAAVMAHTNKTDFVVNLIDKYGDEINQSTSWLNQSIGPEVSAFMKQANSSIMHNQYVLALVMGKVPAQAKNAIARAISASSDIRANVESKISGINISAVKVKVRAEADRILDEVLGPSSEKSEGKNSTVN